MKASRRSLTRVSFSLLALLFFTYGVAGKGDTLKWEKCEANPVITPAVYGRSPYVQSSSPVLCEGQVVIWYQDSGHISRATSPDGIHWTPSPSNPVLSPGSFRFESLELQGPSVRYEDGTYRMWYSGSNGARSEVGYAESEDGISWVKHKDNPVVGVGPPGSYDARAVENPCVVTH